MKQTTSRWLIFTLVALAQFMVVLDSSITNVALPAIKNSLHFSADSLQWVITAYALTFGGFLLLGGRAADQFGRRRMLMIGMTGFTLFSFLIGVSHAPGLLITLRALQGIAAAFMSPSALSIVLATFNEGKHRNLALSLWAIIGTGGAAVGLLLGGALTQFVNWRWNFFINVPVGLTLLTLIPRMVPLHEKEDRDHHLDLPGAALVTGGLVSLVYAFSEAPTWGWGSNGTLSFMALAVVLIAGFLFNEARLTKHPLMPLSIFKIRNVSGGNLIMAPVYAGMMGTFFLTSLYLQQVLKFAPFITGLSFLPFPITVALTSSRMPKLVGKHGFRPFMIAGPLLVAIGAVLLARLPADGNYWINVLPSMIIMPLGVGMTFMPTYAAATSGVPAHEAGLASGMVNTSQQMGGALGLAILSGVAASVTASSAHLGILGALTHGYDRAFLVSAGFMILASIIASTVIVGKRKAAADTRDSSSRVIVLE